MFQKKELLAPCLTTTLVGQVLYEFSFSGVSVFMPTRDSVAHLYPQTLGPC